METVLQAVTILILGAIGGSIFIAMWEWGKRRARKDNPATKGADVIADDIAGLVVERFGTTLDELRDVEALTAQRHRLENELHQLRREKDEIEVTFAQQQRTLEHAAGLLRKELDQELAGVRAEAKHEADERILVKEREFNKQRMEFAEKRFEGELKTLNELVETLTERLPDVSARLKLDGKV